MILATFIVLPDGLLCFRRPEISWQELVYNNLQDPALSVTSSFAPVIFEDEAIQREYIMNFIQVLGELTVAEKPIHIKYITEIAKTPSRNFDLSQKAKVVDYFSGESFLNLGNSSEIYKFYKQ